MTSELAAPEPKALYNIVDDLTCFQETLEMLDAQLAEPLEDDERASIQEARGQVQASIAAIGADLAKKTDAVAFVLRRLGMEREYIHEERTRLKAKEVAAERAEKWLRTYVLSVMQQNGLKQLKTATNTLFIRASEAVEITDGTQIPPEFMNAEVKLPLWLWKRLVAMAEGTPGLDVVRVHAEPSLSTIKKAIKSGVDVAGADLKFNSNLVCR